MLKVINRDGKVVMSTEYRECYPDAKQRKALREAGYKIVEDRRVKSDRT